MKEKEMTKEQLETLMKTKWAKEGAEVFADAFRKILEDELMKEIDKKIKNHGNPNFRRTV